MKKFSMLLLVMIVLSSVTGAQKMFSVEYSSQADVKVFVVKYESEADLNVYKEKYESQAGWRNNSKKGLLN